MASKVRAGRGKPEGPPHPTAESVYHTVGAPERTEHGRPSLGRVPAAVSRGAWPPREKAQQSRGDRAGQRRAEGWTAVGGNKPLFEKLIMKERVKASGKKLEKGFLRGAGGGSTMFSGQRVRKAPWWAQAPAEASRPPPGLFPQRGLLPRPVGAGLP